jgi:hypothetical protein
MNEPSNNGRQLEGRSLRDVLKNREARETARRKISEASRARAKRERDLHQTQAEKNGIAVFNRSQALCLWDLMMASGIGSEATIIDIDNQGAIRVFISRPGAVLPPATYKLLKSGGVEVLADPQPKLVAPVEAEVQALGELDELT